MPFQAAVRPVMSRERAPPWNTLVLAAMEPLPLTDQLVVPASMSPLVSRLPPGTVVGGMPVGGTLVGGTVVGGVVVSRPKNWIAMAA